MARRVHCRPASIVWLGVCLSVLLSTPASAQYFGQNKVQYERFEWEVLETKRFDIYYYPEEREAVQLAARMAERWYSRLSKALDHELDGRQPLILYASHPHFRQTNVIEGGIGEGTGGVTESLKRRVVMPFAGPLAETDHVLGHEIVHAFQYDIGFMMGGRGLFRLPLWYIEGMAEYLSVGPVDPHTAMWLRDAALRDDLPSVRDLNHPRYFPYRWGQALWAFVAGHYGDEAVGEALRIAAGTGDAIGALEEVTGLPHDELSDQWRRAIVDQYRDVLSKAPSEAGGTVLLSEEQHGGSLNIGPALSPDGRWLAFLSEKDLFSIDVFLADAETGRVERKVVSTAADAHFDSLQFLSSAGAWDPTGQFLAFGAIRRGSPVLAIYDAERGRRVQEFSLAELGEVVHPTWAPDGRRIALSGMRGGLSDLFVYDLDREQLSPLTSDAYAAVQPAWSPDGETIVFVTDRFTSDLERLEFGEYRLARIDVESGEIEPVPLFPHGKHINPQWGIDGRTLYFLANPDGVTNVYRVNLASQRIHQVTDVRTGVTGITGLSPALSVAANADRIAFSVQFDTGYEIRTLGTDSGVEVPLEVTDARPAAAVLPPPLEARRNTLVEDMLADHTFGLPAEGEEGEPSEVSRGLGLDYAAQAAGVGTSQFGTYISGGIQLMFSDILGDHTLMTTVLANGEVRDIGGQVAYLNRSRRLNWGVLGGQVPYRWGGVTPAFTDPETGLPAQSVVIQRQTHREIAGLASYPFNRWQRMELSTGYQHVSFHTQEDVYVFDPVTGQIIDRRRETSTPADGVHLGSVSAAFVHDTSMFGPTSPILGSRYRIEATPTTGTLNYTGALADYRHYFVPFRPVTFAVRGLHYGRYGGDGDDSRLRPLYLGSQFFADPGFVRGYDLGNVLDECPVDRSGCPDLDNLIGSRILVANVELRFPIPGIFTGQYDYGPIPIEGLFFGDAGLAWTSEARPSFVSGGTRDWVRSVGAGLRLNALGFAIFELNAVRPLDMPGAGWRFAFNIRPGF